MDQHSNGVGDYLVTLDLGEKFEAYRHIGIETPDPHDQLFEEAQRELVEAVQEALPKANVRGIRMRDLADGILGAATDFVTDGEVVQVSTCPEIADPVNGLTIEINRLVDITGEQIGLGPRPGHDDLRSQLASIKRKIGERSFVIVEDGIFTGTTVQHIIVEMEKLDMKPLAIVAGFAFHESEIANWLAERNIELRVVEHFDGLVDWVPDHDFFPFTPGCGKVLGTMLGDRPYPFYNYAHASYSVPYIMPYGPMTDWASIPGPAVPDLSGFCIRKCIEIYSCLEDLNQQRIAISDLIHAKQRSSVPVTVGQRNLPPLESRVLEYLAESL